MKPSEQALMPTFFKNILEEAKVSKKKPKKGDDEMLLSLAESDAWELYRGIMENMAQDIQEKSKEIIGAAKTWEETAKVYFARDVAIDTIDSLIGIVELRKEAKYAEVPDKEE